MEAHLLDAPPGASSEAEWTAVASEHQRSGERLAKVRTTVNGLGSRAWADSVAPFAEWLLQHLSAEEREIFPRVRAACDDNRLRQTEAAMLEMKVARLGSPLEAATA